jgi:hypothetical protein
MMITKEKALLRLQALEKDLEDLIEIHASYRRNDPKYVNPVSSWGPNTLTEIRFAIAAIEATL